MNGRLGGPQRMAGWVGPRAGLDGFGEGKTLPLPGFEPQTFWPVASCYIFYAILVPVG